MKTASEISVFKRVGGVTVEVVLLIIRDIAGDAVISKTWEGVVA